VYIGLQGTLNKSGGIIYGSDSPELPNQCLSDYEVERGTALVGSSAYYAADNRSVNSTF
jgi:hypothetical protein